MKIKPIIFNDIIDILMSGSVPGTTFWGYNG